MVKLTILATTGLVLNCCCIVIPLSSKAAGLAEQANAGVNAVSTPAFTTAQDPFRPGMMAISASTELDHDGDGRVVCENFNSQVAVHEAYRAAYIQLDGSDKDGRSCKSLR